MTVTAKPIEIGSGDVPLPGLLMWPPEATALLVFAHGAGAGMRHAFMDAFATALAEREIATLRWEFPYMAAGGRRPDRPAVALPAVRRAVEAGTRLLRERSPSLPLFAGGKSFGGRMTSNADAEAQLEGVAGLVFVGFPLHPARKPDVRRADHLASVSRPMLFLQGTRDALAELELLRAVVAGLGETAILLLEDDADHGFHVRKRSGRDDHEVLRSLAATAASWMNEQGAKRAADSMTREG